MQKSPFLHAVTEWDAISRLYGAGKATNQKKFENVLHFKEQKLTSSAVILLFSDVVSAGEKPLVSLFHGKPGLGLNPLRYQRYFENLAAKTSLIEPQNLYPTAEAARFHSLRIYAQVKQWQGERCWHVNGELEVESH